MSHQRTSNAETECPRTRLAEGKVGAVDVCACGMWQLHVGALTLRLAPCAVTELLALLGHAVAEDAARQHAASDPRARVPALHRRRGDA